MFVCTQFCVQNEIKLEKLIHLSCKLRFFYLRSYNSSSHIWEQSLEVLSVGPIYSVVVDRPV